MPVQHPACDGAGPVVVTGQEGGGGEVVQQLGGARVVLVDMGQRVFEQGRRGVGCTPDEARGVVHQPVRLPAVRGVDRREQQFGDAFHGGAPRDERLGGVPVQGHAQGRGHRLVQCLPEQGVPEPEPVAFGRFEHPRGHGLLDGCGQARRRTAEQHRQIRDRERRTEQGPGAQHVPGLDGEERQPVGDRLGQ